MLTQEENARLTQTDQGTPMGDLMRRYWQPIAAVAELDDEPFQTKPVRIMGEDLVLFRTTKGELGLIEKHCAHRRADLAYGIAEENGIRCQYHGWMYDRTGQCIEAPFEDTLHPEHTLRNSVKLRAYPVQELGGLVFAYLGPEPVPLLPNWGPLVWDNVVRDVAITILPCNWLQCQENSLDPVHVEWLHNYYTQYVKKLKGTGLTGGLGGSPPAAMDGFGIQNVRTHQKIGFDLFEHGIIKRRVLEGFTEDDDDWKEGHPILFPNILLVGSDFSATMQFRVPMDDEHTLHISLYSYRAAPGMEAPEQLKVPYRYVPLHDERNKYIVDLTFNQDYSVWASQGSVAKRDLERLGESDKGIVMFRLLCEREMQAVARGDDPMNTFRDPATNVCVEPPLEHVKFGNTRRMTQYTPAEAGVTTAVKDIEAVQATWAAVGAGS